jgi:Cu-Zn family superoxide dismutase
MLRLLAVVAIAAILAAACAKDDAVQPIGGAPPASVAAGQETEGGASTSAARAALVNRQGSDVGEVEFFDKGDKVLVEWEMEGLTPGFHGFHLHSTGRCDGPDFASSGGHFAGAGSGAHPNHAGDLPVVLAGKDGGAGGRFETDRFTIGDIANLAAVVDAQPDRYRPDAPDTGGGDACGVVKLRG